MKQNNALADSILDVSLELAESSSWEAINLHTVAKTLDVSLHEINSLYPQKDDIVEAWFDRADRAVLFEKAAEDFSVLVAHERIQKVMMLWFLSMSEHRRVTRQMLCYKLEFGHIHLQVLGIMRISRTVQWFREAALLQTQGIQRVIEEVLLTRIYLFAFSKWLFDDSDNSISTEEYVHTALRRIRSLK